MNKEMIKSAVLAARKSWVNSFNQGNISKCSATYTTGSQMNARPVGVFNGRASIDEFWQGFVSQSGAKNLIYSNIEIKVLSSTEAELSALWSMNVGKGHISKELWVHNGDSWLIAIDDFTIEEQF